MNNAQVLLLQDPKLLPDVVNDFIKFARRKTSKLEDFSGDMDALTYTLNRRGVKVLDLWETINPPGATQDDEVTNE